jgi:centromeric protein E
LAGSERADQTGATGSRLKEGSHINKSLLTLGQVIHKLSDNLDNVKHINYRDSKLTRILQASLGGNAVTAIICTISPAIVDESRSTLNFAMSAKRVKNKPKVNESVSDATLLKRLRKEIASMSEELDRERKKNSLLKTVELERQIKERSNQILHRQTPVDNIHRRRTWCPTSSLSTSMSGHLATR